MMLILSGKTIYLNGCGIHISPSIQIFPFFIVCSYVCGKWLVFNQIFQFQDDIFNKYLPLRAVNFLYIRWIPESLIDLNEIFLRYVPFKQFFKDFLQLFESISMFHSALKTKDEMDFYYRCHWLERWLNCV